MGYDKILPGAKLDYHVLIISKETGECWDAISTLPSSKWFQAFQTLFNEITTEKDMIYRNASPEKFEYKLLEIYNNNN